MKYQLRRDYGGYKAGDVVEMSEVRARRLKPYVAAFVLEDGVDVVVNDDGTAVMTGPPAQNANKAAWIDYAASVGMDREVAGAMTKSDLVVWLSDGDNWRPLT